MWRPAHFSPPSPLPFHPPKKCEVKCGSSPFSFLPSFSPWGDRSMDRFVILTVPLTASLQFSSGGRGREGEGGGGGVEKWEVAACQKGRRRRGGGGGGSGRRKRERERESIIPPPHLPPFLFFFLLGRQGSWNGTDDVLVGCFVLLLPSGIDGCAERCFRICSTLFFFFHKMCHVRMLCSCIPPTASFLILGPGSQRKICFLKRFLSSSSSLLMMPFSSNGF